MNRTVLFGIVLLGLICGVVSHSYVTTPISRGNQKQSNAGCRGAGCLGPCDIPLKSKNLAPIAISRGQNITIQWPRNNHAGGFIRFAWAHTSESDSHTAFDTNVHQINCHEVGGCHPDDVSEPNGGDSGPGDGSSRACTSVLTVPPHLEDGEWTLQWAWFGGAFSLGDYYSCIDYKISGGSSGKFTPAFVGGDYTYPGQQKCKFFNTNKLHVCVNEPCEKPLFAAAQEQSGVPAFIQENLQSSTPTPPSTPVTLPASTTGKNVDVPSTTGKKVDTPSTTGKKVDIPSTTGKKVDTPSTTGKKVETSSTGSDNTDTCSGSENKCYGTNHYQTCFNGVFAAPQECQSGLICKTSPSSALSYCVRPTDVVRDNGSIDSSSGTKTSIQSMWLATVTLLSVYFML